MGIGANVKKFRTRLGIDQKTLASKLGVTTGAVSNYENDVSSPREEVLYKMFEVFGGTPNELFEGCYEDEPKKSPAPEGTEDEEYKAIVQGLTGMLKQFGWLGPDGDISDEDRRFILAVAAMLDAYFEEKR